MFVIMQKLLLLVFILRMSSCQRRITNGSRVPDNAEASFMVYIIGARVIDGIPGWLCGGSIIHPLVVLTSAACLSESRVKQMFVIAGYKMYVSTVKIDQDPCTKHMKKRIVSVCKHGQFHTIMHSDYFADPGTLRWTKFDIGIAKLDTPIDFFDNDYLKYCSYLPNSIKINFNTKYETAAAEVVTFGWGHSTYYRPDRDLHDYNEPFLMYASTNILDKDECKLKYFRHENFTYIYDRIQNSVFCTHGKGNLDASGKERDPPKPIMIACSVNYTRRTGEDMEIKENIINGTACPQNKTVDKTNNTQNDDIGATRRNGICQNDHGSPVILWIGGQPYVAGVATAFRVNHQMECKGPYLYTSIKCSSQFIYCILNELKMTYTRKFGSSCIKSGAVLDDTELDWEDYEDLRRYVQAEADKKIN